MVKRLLKTLLLPILALATALAFIACDGETTPPDVKFTVAYEIGADATGTAPTETDKASGEKFKLKSDEGIIAPTGKKFGGWNDGSVTYQAGDTYTMPGKNVTFTAQWDDDDTPASKYTVTYKHGAAVDDNGHAVADIVAANQPAGNYTVGNPSLYIYDEEEEATYYFSGWVNEKNKDDDNPTVYLPGQTLALSENTTLEAVWVEATEEVFSAMDTTESVVLFAYPNGIGTYWLVSEENPVWTFYTYTLSQGTITATPVGGSAVTGTIDENGKLTMSIQINGHTYNFVPAQELPQGKPTVSFDANGGTGDAPVIADADIVPVGDNYKITLPQNPYEAPAGKEFDKWEVLSGSKSFGKRSAGETFIANAGEAITLKATWKDAQVAPSGVVFYGNCTLPTKSFFGQTQGGETVVQIIVDTSDPQNVKIKYMLTDDIAYSDEKSGDGSAYAQNMPDVYGDTALYYGTYQIGDLRYSIVVKSDLTALYLCDTDDELLDNGEFTTGGVTPPAPVTYTVTYVKPSGVEGEVPAVATVESGEQVTLELGTVFTKAGWTFVNWAVTGYTTLRAPNTNITVTQNTTITPVFSADYTGASGKIAVRDNGTLVMDGYTYSYTRNGDLVVVDFGDYTMTVKADDAAKTYTMQDGMQALTYTAINNTTLTFDGFGAAMLGTHTGTYTLSEDYDKFTLVIGGNTYSNIAIGTTITVTITIDGTDYVFGSSTPNPPPAAGKLADYASADTSGVFYGYASVADATTAGQNITATNTNNGERTFYQAKVFTNFSGKLSITITANTGSVSNPKNSDNSDIVITEDTPNQTVYITSSSWANQFVITFSKNSDGKRVMTITYGDITVTWVEITD